VSCRCRTVSCMTGVLPSYASAQERLALPFCCCCNQGHRTGGCIVKPNPARMFLHRWRCVGCQCEGGCASSPPLMCVGPSLACSRVPAPLLPLSTAGLDFAYVRHPFQQHSGKKKMSDFVRRRRWIRTRVPLALAAQRRSTAIAQDRFSWSEGAEVAPTAAQLAAVAAAAALENAGDLGAGDVAREVHTVVESIFAQVLAREQMQQALTQQIGSSNTSGHGSPAAGQGLQPVAAAAAGSEQHAALPANAVAGSHGLAQAGAPAPAAAAGQQQVAAHSSLSAAGGAAQLASPSEQLRAAGRPGKLSPGGASPAGAAAASEQPGQPGTAATAPLPHPAVHHPKVPAAARPKPQQEGWPVELAAAAGELAEPGSGGGPPGDDDSLHLVALR
jgi:hypothetical protein